MEQIIEKVSNNVDWMSRNYRGIRDWLESNQ